MQPTPNSQDETPEEVWPPPLPGAAAEEETLPPEAPVGRLALGLSLVSIALVVVSFFISSRMDHSVVTSLLLLGLFGVLVSFVLGLIGWRTWQGIVACVFSGTVLGWAGYVFYQAFQSGFD